MSKNQKLIKTVIWTLIIIDCQRSLDSDHYSPDFLERAIPIFKVFYEVTNEVSGEQYVSASKYIVFCKLLFMQIEKSSAETYDLCIPECRSGTQNKNR